MSLLLAIIAGWTMTRAAIRWSATVRTLGLLGAWRGVRLMVRIRVGQLRRPSTGFVWPIPATTPLLNEIALGLIIVLVLAITSDFSVSGLFRWLALPAHYIPIAIWIFARTAENVLPATGLYLGVSEKGQFQTFIEIGSRNRWLIVSALNAVDYAVSQDLFVKHGHISALLSPQRLKGVPLSMIFEHRRLESIRTADDTWEANVERLVNSVQVIVIDGRSWSSIVENELIWALTAGPEVRLVLVTRKDGSTIFDSTLAKVRLTIADLGGRAVPGRDAATALDDILRQRGERTQRVQIGPESRARLATLLREVSDKTRALLAQINQSTHADHDLDVAIAEWAGINFPDSVPSYTASLTVAMKLVRERLDHPSLTIQQDIDGQFRVELASQPVPMSWRLTTTDPTWFSEAAPAVIHCLLRAELGDGKPLGEQTTVRTWRFPPGYLDESILQSDDFRVSLLNRLYPALTLLPDELDISLRQDLMRWVTEAFGSTNAEELLTNVDDTLRGLVGRVSVDLKIKTDGKGRATLWLPGPLGWLITNSHDAPDVVWGTPSLALIRAALKLDLGLYEQFSRRSMPRNPAALTEGLSSPFGAR